MASISKRVNKDGSVVFRMIIRRKGCPSFCLTFSHQKEAEEWAKRNEPYYIKEPDSYKTWIEKNRLFFKRKREFK